MLLEEEVVLLRKLPIFAEIDPGRLKLLCFASARESFEPGERLFSEGEASFGAYVILSGSVDIFKSSDGSHVTKTGSASKVDIVGQSSMVYEAPRHATITAITPVEALRINHSCFMKLMTTCRKSSEKIMQSLGAQLVQSQSQQEEHAASH